MSDKINNEITTSLMFNGQHTTFIKDTLTASNQEGCIYLVGIILPQKLDGQIL